MSLFTDHVSVLHHNSSGCKVEEFKISYILCWFILISILSQKYISSEQHKSIVHREYLQNLCCFLHMTRISTSQFIYLFQEKNSSFIISCLIIYSIYITIQKPVIYPFQFRKTHILSLSNRKVLVLYVCNWRPLFVHSQNRGNLHSKVMISFTSPYCQVNPKGRQSIY